MEYIVIWTGHDEKRHHANFRTYEKAENFCENLSKNQRAKDVEMWPTQD